MYQINEPGIVTDTKNNLMWKQELEPNRYTWDEAREITSDFGGYSDWRLPTIAELLTLIDFTRYAPAINTEYFPNQTFSFVWSGSLLAAYTYNAWYVDFYGGYVHDGYVYDGSYAVRLVRSGESS